MAEKLLRGTYTAIVTPFNDDFSIDFESFKNHLHDQVKNGVTGVVVCGSTGESATLSTDEKIKLIETAINEIGNEVQIIAGTGSNNTSSSVELTQKAKEMGATAVLLVAPYYNKPTQEGLYTHYKTIAEKVNIPQIIYNVPGRSSVNILPEVQLRLAREYENIIATKEASGDLEQIMTIIENSPEDFSVLSGDDAITVPIIAMGGDGVVSVLSNYAPKQFSDTVNAALEGDINKAKELHYELFELMQLNFIESNPVPAKTALNLMGFMKDNFRLPLVPITKPSKDKLTDALKRAGIL